MTFALRNDDGVEHPDQVAYVDGYSFGDTLLEGVRFRVQRFVLGTGHQLCCSAVHPDDASYMMKFNYSQKSAWYRAAVRTMVDDDGQATAEDGTDVHWGEE